MSQSPCSYPYHTIETLYEDFSKYPKDVPVNMTFYEYFNITITKDRTCNSIKVNEEESWNSIHFINKLNTVGNVLSILEKHVKTNAEALVCLGSWPMKKETKHEINVSNTRIFYMDTHLNSFPTIEKIEKETSDLIALLSPEPDKEIVYKFLQNRLQNTEHSAYILNDMEIYFNREKLMEKYDLLTKETLDKIFKQEGKYNKIFVCCHSKEKMLLCKKAAVNAMLLE